MRALRLDAGKVQENHEADAVFASGAGGLVVSNRHWKCENDLVMIDSFLNYAVPDRHTKVITCEFEEAGRRCAVTAMVPTLSKHHLLRKIEEMSRFLDLRGVDQ